MTLSPTQRTLLLILTLLPLLLIPVILYQVFSFIMDTVEASRFGEPEPLDILNGILQFIIPIIFTALLSMALMVFYIIHAAKNPALDTTEKLVWILLFFFVGIISFVVYWILRTKPESSETPRQSNAS